MNDRLGTRMRAMKALLSILLIAVVAVILSGCTGLPAADGIATAVGNVKDGGGVPASAKEAPPTSTANSRTASPTSPPVMSRRATDEAVVIVLGERTTVKGAGASVEGSTVRISASGTYNLSGKLKDGQIVVDTEDKNTVKLVLNGVDVTSSSSAPIYIKRAKETIIALSEGTENHITDGESYVFENPAVNEPDAAIFSKGNLTFNGSGSLTIEANYRNAIDSKDELNIASGNITVSAANDGIRGRDYIAVKNGNITVRAKADGMQSSNDSDPERGFISIEGGNINITAGEDGIQAVTSVVVSGGTTRVSSGGGSAGSAGSGNNLAPSVNGKGLRAVSAIRIEGGTIAVDSADDAIHSNNRITIDDGKIVLASLDQGIHADSTLTINGGDISITKSLEAIEAAAISINGGNIRLVASDDGVNVAGGNDRAAVNGRPNRANFDGTVDKHLTIQGGYVVIDATGDGMDINGWVKMTGGTVIVIGPTVDFNGALDYDREFTMAGGTLVAVGSFGMAQGPDATSSQSSLILNLGAPQPAGTLVHVQAEDGRGILTFAPSREYQSVVYSSSELKKGATYNIYLGGTSTGSVVDGLYSGGSYAPGKRSASVRI